MTQTTLSQLNSWARRVEEKRQAARAALDSRAIFSSIMFNEYTQSLHRYRLALREYTKEIEDDANRS